MKPYSIAMALSAKESAFISISIPAPAYSAEKRANSLKDCSPVFSKLCGAFPSLQDHIHPLRAAARGENQCLPLT